MFPVAAAIFAFAMVYAGLTDLTTMRIRNNLCLWLFASYAALAPFVGFTVEQIAWSAAFAAGLSRSRASFLFAFGWMGGGDGKLLAVTALWLGVDHAPAFLIYTGLFGGALTLRGPAASAGRSAGVSRQQAVDHAASIGQ